jgi:acyl phosphate:glycerol-3-phosphate acyltransferase
LLWACAGDADAAEFRNKKRTREFHYTLLVLPLLSTSLLLAAFLCGSIPCGFFIARARGIDIRTHGSGNIGATNVWRVCGRGPGLLCFLLDFLKGLAPSLLAGALLNNIISTRLATLSETSSAALWLAVALAAVLGHMFTPWLGFKGGKGISTGFGALIGIYPVFTLAALIALIAWLLALAITRMVGISSVLAAAALTLIVVGSHFASPSLHATLSHIPIYQRATTIHACFAAALLLLIIYKHRANIARTFKGTEPRIGQKKPA